MLPLHISATERLPAHAHACHYMRKSVLHLPHPRLPQNAQKRVLHDSNYTRVCSEICKSSLKLGRGASIS